MALRPMTTTLLNRRRRNLIRNYEVSVLNGILVANTNALNAGAATDLLARL